MADMRNVLKHIGGEFGHGGIYLVCVPHRASDFLHILSVLRGNCFFETH
jgi:hypothetical protein